MLSDPLETAIYQELARVYVCTLDELSGLLTRFSSAHVAATVERLIESGSIACRSSDPSRVLLWLPPLRSARRHRTETPAGSPMEPMEIEEMRPDYAPQRPITARLPPTCDDALGHDEPCDLLRPA